MKFDSKTKVIVVDDKLMARANDNWAEVELWRWQRGQLDSSDQTPLDISLGAKNMAQAIRDGQVEPFAAASVILYLAKKLEEKK